ncbi:MAG: protein phosphatase 2C domain-containing protein, partial [Ruminococcus flavefaciens]|nr:protein phosphatase 2C domain-containing protein [Ruminococcus flavefaciens]
MQGMTEKNKYRICVISDAGRVRTNNEDNYACLDFCMQTVASKQDRQFQELEADYPFVLAVFDGMGGLKAGEVAALKAAKELSTGYRQDWYEEESMETIIRRLNTAVCEESEKVDCGCTVVLCRIIKNQFYIANVGDSRAYLYQANHLVQMS